MKKTKFQKVLGRKPEAIIYRYEKLPMIPGREQRWRTLQILDFTGK